MKEQYQYLKKLETLLFQGFRVTKNVLKNNQYVPTYRTELENQEQTVDHRTIGSNEIIIDLDFNSYTLVHKHVNLITMVLEERKIPYYIFSTGGKGIHIQLIFDKINLEYEELKKLFEEAISYNFTWKHIRLYLINKICEEAGINKAHIGKYIDLKKVNFNDEDQQTLIRACGGRNQKFDDITGTTENSYKTWIPNEEFNNKRVKVKNISNVRYPDKIELFQINPHELGECMKEYIQFSKEKKVEQQKNVKLENGYTGLSSVQRIIEGLEQGLRSEGARVLSAAIVLDGFSDSRAEQVLQQYVNNCSQIGHRFTLSEAMNWYKWLKLQPVTYWNNEAVKKLGVWEKDLDEYYKASHKDSLKLLKSKGILKRIDDYLKNIIVGEKENRMLIFLLLLSCKFKVEKGWNIPGDPKPQSIILSSMSASGKSYITKAILNLFGDEGLEYYSFSRMTGAVLNYFTDVDMTGKTLFVEELQGLDKDSNQLRLWISEGKLKLATVEKVESDGETKNSLVIKESTGQPVFITGTAEDMVDEQMNNRSWLISLDISQQQNKAILEYESKSYSSQRNINNDELRKIQDAIKELGSYHFIIPYFDYEWLNIPTNDVRIRRDFKKFGDLIACVTLLHQKQRIVVTDDVGREYLVSNLEDYEIAVKYSEKVLESTFSGLTAQQIWVLNQIKNQVWSDEFESGDIQRMTSWSQSKCYRTLEQLEEVGVLTSSNKSQGRTAMYSLNTKKNLVNLSLPSSSDLLEIVEKNNATYSQILKNYVFYYQEGVKIDFFQNSRLSHVDDNLVTENQANEEKKFIYKEVYKDYTQKVAQKVDLREGGTSKLSCNPIINNKEKLIKFFEKSTNHIISETELIAEFGEEIIDLLDKLKVKGDIFQSKPGYWMIL